MTAKLPGVKPRVIFFLAAAVFLPALLHSCVDARAAVSIRRDGSGTIGLEYEMDGELADLGRQEGSARWLPVPVGPADFERAAARLPGIRYRSGGLSRKDGKVLSRVRLDFENIPALLGFFDASGRSSFREEEGRKILSLSLTGGPDSAGENPLAEALRGHALEIGFSFPAAGELRLQRPDGNRLETPPGWVLETGRNARFRAPLEELLTLTGDLNLVAVW